MSKAAYWQRGEAIDFPNTTEAAIEENQIVQIGNRIGVAGTPIAPGETGSLHVFGVFEMPKDDAAITLGADVYFKDDAITATKPSGGVAVGYATEAAGADDTMVKVKLLG